MKRTTITVGMLLIASNALAAGVGIPELSTVYTQFISMSGTIGGICIVGGMLGGLAVFLWRHSASEAMGFFALLLIIGTLVSNIQALMSFFFPLAAAVIR